MKDFIKLHFFLHPYSHQLFKKLFYGLLKKCSLDKDKSPVSMDRDHDFRSQMLHILKEYQFSRSILQWIFNIAPFYYTMQREQKFTFCKFSKPKWLEIISFQTHRTPTKYSGFLHIKKSHSTSTTCSFPLPGGQPAFQFYFTLSNVLFILD